MITPNQKDDMRNLNVLGVNSFPFPVSSTQDSKDDQDQYSKFMKTPPIDKSPGDFKLKSNFVSMDKEEGRSPMVLNPLDQ